MIRVKLEIWLSLGKELGRDFRRLSEITSIREEELEEGITFIDFINHLAESYQAIRERIFDSSRNIFYPGILVTLNEQIISQSTIYDKILKEGDKIAVLPLYVGG